MGRGGREFNPTAAELISYYLKNHILGISYPASDIIPQSTVFGDQLNPWDKFSDPCHWCLDSHNIPTLYLHTKLENIGTTSKSSNVQKKRMAGCGTWHSTGAPIEVHFPGNKDLVIGHYKKLSFRTNNGEETIGHWTMNEYTISADAFPEIRGCDWEDRVICRIKRYDDRSCIGGKVIKNNSSSTRGRSTVSNKRKNSSSIQSTEPIKKLKSSREPSNQMTAPVVVVLDDGDGEATMPEPSNQMAAPVVVVLDDDDGEATMPKEWTNSDALEFEELMNGTASEPLHFEEWKDSDVLEFEDIMNGIEWDASVF